MQEVRTGTVILKRADEEDVSEYVRWNMRFVMEGLLWESVRAFLVPDVVLCVRMTAGQWNVAGLSGLLPNSTSSS